jgi:hypothetical protein
MVLISDLARQKKIHWLEVVLVGTNPIARGGAPPFACTVADKTYTRYNDGKSGLSQSVLPGTSVLAIFQKSTASELPGLPVAN